jgi:hypothetical protein
MPVPLIKARGQPGRGIENNPPCRAAIPGSGEWPGQALQDDTIPQGAGGGGGGRAGSVLVSINIPGPLFKAFKG